MLICLICRRANICNTIQITASILRRKRCVSNRRENINLYSKDYYDYIELLSSGETYSILISKRLLIQPMVYMWMCILGLFLVNNNVFFAIVGIPCFVIFGVFLIMFFPLWNSCNISLKAYTFFHIVSILCLKFISVPISFLLEELWILCF